MSDVASAAGLHYVTQFVLCGLVVWGGAVENQMLLTVAMGLLVLEEVRWQNDA